MTDNQPVTATGVPLQLLAYPQTLASRDSLLTYQDSSCNSYWRPVTATGLTAQLLASALTATGLTDSSRLPTVLATDKRLASQDSLLDRLTAHADRLTAYWTHLQLTPPLAASPVTRPQTH